MIRTIQPVTKLTTIISTQSQELWKWEGLIQVILRQKFKTELMTQTQAVKISRLTVSNFNTNTNNNYENSGKDNEDNLNGDDSL